MSAPTYDPNHPELSQLDFWDMPRTPRQKTEEYKAMITIAPKRSTYVPTPADPWLPLKRSLFIAGLAFAAVTAAVIIRALS